MKTLDFKTVLGLVIILISLFGWKSALALRCGNELIRGGEPLHKVQEACKNGKEYRVQNQNADIVKYYYEQGGMTNEMIFIDGNLKEIKSSR